MNDDELTAGDRAGIARTYLKTPQGQRQMAAARCWWIIVVMSVALLIVYLCQRVPGWHGSVYVPLVCGPAIVLAEFLARRSMKNKLLRR